MKKQLYVLDVTDTGDGYPVDQNVIHDNSTDTYYRVVNVQHVYDMHSTPQTLDITVLGLRVEGTVPTPNVFPCKVRVAKSKS